MKPATLPKPSPHPDASHTTPTRPPSPRAVPAKKKRPRWRKFVAALVGLAVVAGLGWLLRWWYLPVDGGTTEITATVVRGDLPVVVTERGELESSTTITAKCEVEIDQIKIVPITAERTRGKKGDVVVR